MNYRQDVKKIISEHLKSTKKFLEKNKKEDSVSHLTKLEDALLKMKDKKIDSENYHRMINIIERLKLKIANS
jgi:hypothetical protein